jgi:hypothetical protein
LVFWFCCDNSATTDPKKGVQLSMLPCIPPSKRVFTLRQCARSLFIVLVLLSLLNVPSASAFGLASISISDSSVVEGDSGSVNMMFTVTRTGDMTSTVVVGYTTADGTALAGTDYVAQTGTVTIPSGASSATISIPVIGNTIVQGNRSFSVQLTNVVDMCGPSITLAPQQTFGTDNNPWSIAVGDFNNDGHTDLVSSNYGSNTISVLLNTTAPGAATPVFAPQQTFSTGINSGPISVVVSDFNGDGKLDLASANQVSNNVLVLLNTTTPGEVTPIFASQQIYVAGIDPVSMAVGDFNGDGKPDLAIANYGSNTVSVLLNTTTPGGATPSFATKQDFGTGSYPYSVSVGDFNGDGRPDLVIANGSNTVSVLLNTTNPGAVMPSFALQQTFIAGDGPVFVAVGDFNGDGKPDLASANYNSNTISVLLNTTAPGAASASFTTQQTFGASAGPASLTVDDFNRDGRPDLASANHYSNTVSVLLNTTAPGATTPSFATQQTFSTGNNSNPNSVAVGDFNGDGRPDLASANYSSHTVSVLLNTTTFATGPLAFTTQQPFSTGSWPDSVIVGDFNGDGRPDLASANGGPNTVSVLLNTTAPGETTPSFAPQQSFDTGVSPRSVAVGDFNSDGKLDLASANYDSDTVSVLLNTITPGAATPSFAPQQSFGTGANPIGVAVGDFNSDGKPDLASANLYANTVSVLLNITMPGATTPSFTNQRTYGTGISPHSVAVGDFNGDGRPDLAIANYYSHTVSVLSNTTAPGATTPSFASQQAFSTGSFTYPVFVAVGDFNGDGKADLASANSNTNNVSVLLNTTVPGATALSFAPGQAFSTGFTPDSVAVNDFNGDGKLDLASGNVNSDNISVLINTMPPGATIPAFAPQQAFGAVNAPVFVTVADFNGDGRLDLVSVNQDSNNVSVLLNLGAAITSSTATGTITDDDAPASMTKAAGDDQSASIYAAFPAALAVDVKNGAGHLVQGASVTFTAPSSGASGTFASSATVTTDAAGRATAPVFTANGTAGAYQVTASVAGVASPAQFSLTNNKGDTTTTITDTPDPSVYSQSYTVNFTVDPVVAGAGTPTGNVTVSDGVNNCTATVVAGTCSLPSTDVGSRTLTATYTGDDNFNGSSSSTSHEVNKADTTTTVSGPTHPTVVGQPYAVNFSVTAIAPGAGTPTGNVTVSDGTHTCTATVAAGMCSLTATTLGPRTLTATYAGDGNYTGSSNTTSHEVIKADTSTTLTDTPDPSVYGQSYAVDFSVAAVAPGAGTPTGSVTVSDGVNTCTTTVAAGTCTLPSTAAGSRTLTATYAGDDQFNGSAGTTAHTVNKAGTTTTLTDTPDPSVYGQPYTVNFSVVAVTPGAGTPTGNVTVSDGVNTCTAPVAVGTCTLPSTVAGSRTLTATYTGDGNYTGSSGTTTHTVNKADTTTTVSGPTHPTVVGQSYTVNFTVASLVAGVGTPTGNVTVSDGVNTCTATVAAGTCSLTATTLGPRTLTATYAGDGNFNGSAGSASHVVNKSSLTVDLQLSASSVAAGQPVRLTATVTQVGPVTGPITGTVTFLEGSTILGTAELIDTGSSFAAQLIVSDLALGDHSLSASYGGSETYEVSSSDVVHLTVLNHLVYLPIMIK